jgi:hypothetical protein
MKMVVFWAVAPYRLVGTNVLEKIIASIIGVIMKMEAVRSSETTISIYQTTCCNIPEYSHLQISYL